MAMTIAGFQGTVSETQWAQIMTAVAQKYTLTSGDPVRSSGRTLLIDPRASVGAGVLVTTDTVTSVTVPAPTTGQWHLLVLRRTWGASRSAQYLLIPGATGPNAAQTEPPTTLPAARNRSVGVVDDEPVAWAYARSGTTELQLWQMSARPGGVVPGPWAVWDFTEQGPVWRWESEWVTIPLLSGFVVQNSQPLQWRMKNGALQFRGRIGRSNSSAIGGSYVTITGANALLGALVTNAGWDNRQILTPGSDTNKPGLLLIQSDGSLRAAIDGIAFFSNAQVLV